MARVQEGPSLDRTWMDGCLGSPDEMRDTWARSRWHDRASCDGRRHPMAQAREGQCLDRTQMDGCSGSLNEMSDTWAHSRWHDRASCDGQRHPKTRDGVKTYGSCRWRSRWQEETQWCIERPWPRAKARSSRMTWSSVEANWMCHRRLNMHAQAACVVEQAWISYKQCSIGEDESRLSSDEATKSGRKIYIQGLIPFKASRECVKITTPCSQKSRTISFFNRILQSTPWTQVNQ